MGLRRFTKEQIECADTRDIIAVARELGLNVIRKGRELRAEGYGGLVLNRERNCFNCFSAGLCGEKNHGGGPIQLVMYIKRCTFVEAVYYLTGEPVTERQAYRRPAARKKTEKKPFVLPEKNRDFRRMYAYLLQTRGISRRVVDYFVQQKVLYENTYGSCVFVGTDKEGIPRHCSTRGTVSRNAFKGEAPGSDKRYAFHKTGKNDILHVYEAPIDLMSYLSLYPEEKDDHHLALCCLADNALGTYLKNHEIKCLVLHLDNDRWGRRQTEKLINKYGGVLEVWDQPPDKTYKDYNDMLTGMAGKGETM